jgi:MOSC domain-containing protein YiiM
MRFVEAVEAIADRGLIGDRYMDAHLRRSGDYQITLIEVEQIEAFTSHTGLQLSPEAPRRNVVTREVALNDFLGQRFRVGEVLLEGLKLCEPCTLFRDRTYPEVLRFFVHRGGLRARILSGGVIRRGDPIQIASAAARA